MDWGLQERADGFIEKSPGFGIKIQNWLWMDGLGFIFRFRNIGLGFGRGFMGVEWGQKRIACFRVEGLEYCKHFGKALASLWVWEGF